MSSFQLLYFLIHNQQFYRHEVVTSGSISAETLCPMLRLLNTFFVLILSSFVIRSDGKNEYYFIRVGVIFS